MFESQALLEQGETKYPDPILVDTDAIVALLNEQDANHRKALEVVNFLVRNSLLFVISNHVFGESLTVVSKKVGHKEAVDYLHQVKGGLFEILRINEKLEDLAYNIFADQSSKNVSFIDCTNMAVLIRYRWNTIFSFDQVYPKNGFKLAIT